MSGVAPDANREEDHPDCEPAASFGLSFSFFTPAVGTLASAFALALARSGVSSLAFAESSYTAGRGTTGAAAPDASVLAAASIWTASCFTSAAGTVTVVVTAPD